MKKFIFLLCFSLLVTMNMDLSSTPVQQFSTSLSFLPAILPLPVDGATLYGIINDKKESRPICGASVVVTNHDGLVIAAGLTDNTGIYVFHNLPPILCNIEVSAVGYYQKNINDVQLTIGTPCNINAILED